MKSRAVMTTCRSLLLSTQLAMIATLPVHAAEPITIEPQSLASALQAFSEQSGLQVGFEAQIAKGLQTQGTRDAKTPAAALDALLSGTNLEYRFVNEKTVVIRPKTQETSALGGDAAQVMLEEIIVTAQKRAERLLDVPVSVTAMTGSEMKARGITNLLEAQYAIPGLTLTEFGPGLQRAQLRGVGTPGGSQGLATVGFYLDEMPINIGASAGLDVRLIDMERVEVLRGPQPTLYGEGSMGGTIRYITASPDLDTHSARFEGEWGAIEDGGESYRAAGVVNIPLIENKLAVRVAAAHENMGGWIDARASGEEDINEATLTTFRAKVLFLPTDNLSISLLALHQEQDQDYQNFAAKDRTTTARFPTRNDDRYDLANLVVSYDFGPATFLSTTGYLERRPASAYDLTLFYGALLNPIATPPNSITSVGLDVRATTRMWTQELRLSSNGAGPLNYTLGAYYRDPRVDSVQDVAAGPGTVPFVILAFDGKTESKAWAAFGDVSYDITERLQVLVGARYFEDERSEAGSTTQFGFASADPSKQATFDTVNPRFNLSYKTSDDGLIYFNAAKGFRSGGFNSTAASLGGTVAPTYGPEELFSYELGTKQQWLGRRLMVEAAVYYNEWEDFQAQTVLPGSVLPIFTNNGKASGPGADFSLTARPTGELTLSATLGYTDMEYDTDSPDRFKGDTLDLVAEWTYSAAVDYRHALAGDTTLVARADYQHTDGYTLTLRNFIFPPGSSPFHDSDPRDVINARIGADFGTFEVYLFGDNLTDDDGTLYPAVGTFLEPVLSRPRTFGVELRADF